MSMPAIFAAACVLVLVGGAVAAAGLTPRLSWWARVPAVLILLSMGAFFGFGFLAANEPPGSPNLRMAYAVLGAACAIGAGMLLMPRRAAA